MGRFFIRPLRLSLTLLHPLLTRQLARVIRRNSLGAPPRGPRRGSVVAAGESLKVVVIGDSIVNGSDIPNHTLSLGGRLADALSARTGRTVGWAVLGAGGITPETVSEKYLTKIEREKPDVVVIGLGGNCLVRFYTPEHWVAVLAEVVDGVRSRVGDAPLILAGMPPVWQLKAIPQPLRTYLALRGRLLGSATERLARARPGVFVGPTYVANRKEYLGPDGCHPSVQGYVIWGERLAEAIAPLLAEAPAAAPARDQDAA